MSKADGIEFIRNNPKSFPWGHIEKISEVACPVGEERYTIITFSAKLEHGGHETLHLVYVGDRCTNVSTRTFDGALLYAVAHRAGAPEFALAMGRIVNLKEL